MLQHSSTQFLHIRRCARPFKFSIYPTTRQRRNTTNATMTMATLPMTHHHQCWGWRQRSHNYQHRWPHRCDDEPTATDDDNDVTANNTCLLSLLDYCYLSNVHILLKNAGGFAPCMGSRGHMGNCQNWFLRRTPTRAELSTKGCRRQAEEMWKCLRTWLQHMCCALAIPASSYFGGLRDRETEVRRRSELPEGRGDRGEQRGVHRKYSR